MDCRVTQISERFVIQANLANCFDGRFIVGESGGDLPRPGKFEAALAGIVQRGYESSRVPPTTLYWGSIPIGDIPAIGWKAGDEVTIVQVFADIAAGLRLQVLDMG
jgi:hypothetical protein